MRTSHEYIGLAGLFIRMAVHTNDPFKKAEFLATPVYSRDYPPCKFCN